MLLKMKIQKKKWRVIAVFCECLWKFKTKKLTYRRYKNVEEKTQQISIENKGKKDMKWKKCLKKT
jgi:hypothetical protein